MLAMRRSQSSRLAQDTFLSFNTRYEVGLGTGSTLEPQSRGRNMPEHT